MYVGTSHPESYDITIDQLSFFEYSVCIKTPKGQGEIWKYDGEQWQQINEDGFGDQYNIGIRELKVYDGKLVACVMNPKTGCEIWETDIV
jgi:hypothetical protein